MMSRTLTALMILAMAAPALAESTSYPGADWEDAPDPIASPFAERGGDMDVFVAQYPKSFNYYLDNNVFSAQLFGQLFDSLLTMNPVTLQHEPGLAERCVLSDDKKTFTLHLDPEAQWSDGEPVTADDVAWTYRTIMKPEHLTGPHKVSLEKFNEPEVLDEHTVRFTANEVHWRNLLSLGGLNVLPRHAYEDKDFNKLNFEFPVVSGPYRIEEIQEGRTVTLARRDDWWQGDAERNLSVGNFSEIIYHFFSERDNAFQSFKTGGIDLFAVYTAHRWVEQTDTEKFRRNWIVKQKVYNHKPIGFQGFAMNMRRAPFDDRRVRLALAHLLNRPRLNKTLMHNQYFLHRSYYEDLYSEDHPCPNELIAFDKERARALLKEAGWETDPETGLLMKDGAPLEINFLTRSATADKFLVIYKEDLLDVGITLNIVKKDWAAWSRDMEEYNYDMTWAAWGAGLWKDPESMWHSKEADRPSGNNITGFRNEEVDRLIDKTRTIFDVQERRKVLREIDQRIYREVPYVLLWNIDYTRLLYWNKFGTPDTVLSKYGDEQSAYAYWWYDYDAAAELEQARDEDLTLAPRPGEVRFDAVFSDQPLR